MCVCVCVSGGGRTGAVQAHEHAVGDGAPHSIFGGAVEADFIVLPLLQLTEDGCLAICGLRGEGGHWGEAAPAPLGPQ